MNTSRSIILAALLAFGLMSAALPPWFCPLHLLVPEPYFLRSKSQLDNTEIVRDIDDYFTRQARPAMVAMILGLLLWAGFAWFSSSRGSAIALLIVVLVLPALTFLRFLTGGGFSGGM